MAEVSYRASAFLEGCARDRSASSPSVDTVAAGHGLSTALIVASRRLLPHAFEHVGATQIAAPSAGRTCVLRPADATFTVTMTYARNPNGG